MDSILTPAAGFNVNAGGRSAMISNSLDPRDPISRSLERIISGFMGALARMSRWRRITSPRMLRVEVGSISHIPAVQTRWMLT